MTNRYDKIPDHKVIKSAMQQELTDKQIEYVKSEIETSAFKNDDKAYVNLIGFNSSQKRKLGQILTIKGYKFVKESSWSLIVFLQASVVRFKRL